MLPNRGGLSVRPEAEYQEFQIEQSAKKYHIQLQRLAGKKVVDGLELYQYDFNSVLYKDNDADKKNGGTNGTT